MAFTFCCTLFLSNFCRVERKFINKSKTHITNCKTKKNCKNTKKGGQKADFFETLNLYFCKFKFLFLNFLKENWTQRNYYQSFIWMICLFEIILEGTKNRYKQINVTESNKNLIRFFFLQPQKNAKSWNWSSRISVRLYLQSAGTKFWLLEKSNTFWYLGGFLFYA